eukprot:2539703-Rhodomonas_salina.3
MRYVSTGHGVRASGPRHCKLTSAIEDRRDAGAAAIVRCGRRHCKLTSAVLSFSSSAAMAVCSHCHALAQYQTVRREVYLGTGQRVAGPSSVLSRV